MARRSSTRLRDGVPFLQEKEIEAEASLLLEEYAQTRPWQMSAPVPVEDIIEIHLRLAYAIEDLQELLHVPDVLGAIWFSEKEIRVDVRLDPTNMTALLRVPMFAGAPENAGRRCGPSAIAS